MSRPRPTLAELKRQPWWPAAWGLSLLDFQVIVRVPTSELHHSEWDGVPGHGVIRIVPTPGVSTWSVAVCGGIDSEGPYDDSERTPVPW